MAGSLIARRWWAALAASAALGVAGAGCAPPASLDAQLRAVIAARSLTGDPSIGRDLPGIDDPTAQLGRKLFFSKALGGDKDTACASCHHPLLGGADGLGLPIGAGAVDPDRLGPGRAHPSGVPTVPRNSPTTFNSALWDRAMFHDGRVESLDKLPGANGAGPGGIRTPDTPFLFPDPLAGANLAEAQSRFPITSQAEMRGRTYAAHASHRVLRDHICARLGNLGVAAGELPGTAWPAEFARVFGPRQGPEALLSDAHIAAAIGAYERSQTFVDTPWRAYVQGEDDALTPEAKRGALVFLRSATEGGANCAACHAGDAFTDERYYVLAVPQVGPGKDDDPYPDRADDADEDFGRFHATFHVEDRYAFRTPSLLNVVVTAPYGHDGAYRTLEGIVRHHLDPVAAVAGYDASQLDPGVQTGRMAANTVRALAKLAEDRRLGRTPLPNVDLTDAQVQEIVAFLDALTDPCVTDPACLAPWLPAEGETDPDGLRLVARIDRKAVR
jgi:cytochrome c peroxidase